MSPSTVFPDVNRYQPQCAMPRWDDSCVPALPWRGLAGQDGAGVWGLGDAAWAGAVYEDLEAALGEHTAHTPPGADETRELTCRLVPALRQLADTARLLAAATAGTEAHRAVGRARDLLTVTPPADPLPAFVYLRRVALATLDLLGLLELSGDSR
ncbi:DUF6415 family natural product biosynthesis protein [Streptomyces syringium]|uniref:Uncharacterized protein n=1 Tax=Streptomyces syringium TaxID=76729 RepID=A0ABS4XW59_9ACTN|nr:DUF6415 family natural product biosynthesis protein [Streptomyces syringium]MBP2400742.1 hypothetical protein [Streptomyces syringium]